MRRIWKHIANAFTSVGISALAAAILVVPNSGSRTFAAITSKGGGTPCKSGGWGGNCKANLSKGTCHRKKTKTPNGNSVWKCTAKCFTKSGRLIKSTKGCKGGCSTGAFGWKCTGCVCKGYKFNGTGTITRCNCAAP